MQVPDQLASVQHWMQSLLTVADQPTSESAIEAVIQPSTRQTSAQRLAVYQQAYVARLLECLRDEFRVLCQFLGQETFDALAVAYLHTWPSASYTLGELGRRFPEFLRDAANDDISVSQSPDEVRGHQFVLDLARVERCYAEVFDGPGTETLPPLSTDHFRDIRPDEWPDLRLETAPCLRLLELSCPVHEFISASRRSEEPSVPEFKPTWLAVSRRQYIVRRTPLEWPQYLLLESLQQQAPLSLALEQLSQQVDASEFPAICQRLQSWFHEWTASGFFTAVVRPFSMK